MGYGVGSGGYLLAAREQHEGSVPEEGDLGGSEE